MTVKIYSAIKSSIEKNVSADELEKYLRCKFWKTSREEADLFYCLYMLPVHFGFPGNIVAILSGQLFQSGGIYNLFDEIKILENIYRSIKLPQEKIVVPIFTEQALKLFIVYLYDSGIDLKQSAILILGKLLYLIHDVGPIFFKIINTIITDNNESYPLYGLIDDVVNWALLKKIIDIETANLIEKELATTRINIPYNTEESFLKELIELLIEHHAFIFYNDAQVLLFPEHDLLAELKEAVLSEKIRAYSSANDDFFYFHTTTLLKWLMQNAYLSDQLSNAFPSLKIESIKESKIQYIGKINSLQKFIQQGEDRNDIFDEALNGATTLYLKYPRDLLKWRHYSYSSALPKPKETATQRFNGLGQLKRTKTDDSAQCQFGGLTIDMLFYGESPEHHLSKQIPNINYEIELVQTEDEANSGLQPYLSIPPSKLALVLADDRLCFLDNLVLPKTKNKKKKDSPKKPNRLQLLIQKYLLELNDKSPEAVWRQIRNDREDYELWIDKIDCWGNGREGAAIKWGTPSVTNKTMKRAAFETYVSELNTGKRPFAKEQYDEMYED